MKPESRWMVRAEDGAGMQYNEYSIREIDSEGYPRFIERPYDEVAVLAQLPHNVAKWIYVRCSDTRKWIVSPLGIRVFGMDSAAREAFRNRTSESMEILEERKQTLQKLVQNEPVSLVDALRELCFRPNSDDPRYSTNIEHWLNLNQECVLNAAKRGELLISTQFTAPTVRIMDLVRYLADDKQKHNPVCDYFWRYAYRQIIKDGWMPGKEFGQLVEVGPENLTPVQREIVLILANRAMKGEAIAIAMNRSYGGYVKGELSGLVKRGILKSARRGGAGYTLMPKYRYLLKALLGDNL